MIVAFQQLVTLHTQYCILVRNLLSIVKKGANLTHQFFWWKNSVPYSFFIFDEFIREFMNRNPALAYDELKGENQISISGRDSYESC
jgi:hypothetical protein